jgi:DNA polymerase (family 10)
MINQELAKIFDTFADILEIQDNSKNKFKIRAYRQASLTIQNLPKEITDYIDLENEKFKEDIPGFGEAIRHKSIEYIKTKKVTELEALKLTIPAGLLEMLEIKNLGPKKVKKFYQELNIGSVEALKKAIQDGEVQKLEGMGEKSASKILDSIINHEQYSSRTPIGLIYPTLKEIENYMLNHPKVLKAVIAGSARRFQDTIGDIDLLVTSKTEDRPEIINHFKLLPFMQQIEAEGETKVTARLNNGIQIDLRLVQKDEFGAAMQYFTGNQSHNVKLRTIAKNQGYKINEYGIFEIDTNKKVGGEFEKEIYEVLGLNYIEPQLRQGNIELDPETNQNLPVLIDISDIKGDLHTHSTYSDGANSIEEMVLKAKQLGYEYIGITDHSPSLKVANGLDKEKLLQKKHEIEKLKNKLNFNILYGTEVDILNNGELDYNNQILTEFDIVIASIHSNLEKDTTTRILTAMQNPFVHIIGHPTTRLIGKREGSPLNINEIFKMAEQTQTILECNAQPTRLDLPSNLVLEAKQKYQLKFSINTDAHNAKGLELMELGVNYFKRGWLSKEDVINTYNSTELTKILKRKTIR